MLNKISESESESESKRLIKILYPLIILYALQLKIKLSYLILFYFKCTLSIVHVIVFEAINIMKMKSKVYFRQKVYIYKYIHVI